MDSVRNPPGLWQGQLLHFTSLIVLVPIVGYLWISHGKLFPVIFWGSVIIPILHQVFVWISWRLELLSSSISRRAGFKLYIAIFFTLFSGRFISVFWLAYVDKGSLKLPFYPQMVFTFLALVPGLYAIYSVKRYFGMVRAAGADHFDESYRNMPFVKEGIFRFTGNAMYVYAFLIFWSFAIGFNSILALIIAAFSHVYIWVLFYSTEKPDMDFIYS